MTLLEEAQKAVDVAREAYEAGDKVTAIAALELALQLLQVARLFQAR